MNSLEEIHHTVILKASVHTVWEKTATAEGIEQWFMPTYGFHAEEGEKFRLQTPFGTSPCEMLEVVEREKLSFAWDKEGWVVTFYLMALPGNQTKFTLVHSGWKEADEWT